MAEPIQPRSKLPFDSRLKLAIRVVTVCVILALIVFRAVDLLARRREILDVSERRAANLSLILSEYLRGSFVGADEALRQLTIHSRLIGGPSAPASVWIPLLKSARAGLTAIGSISVTDTDGIIRHSTIDQIIGQSRASDYLVQQLAIEKGNALIADTPFRTLVGRPQLVIPIGRRLTNNKGEFEGTVVASFIPGEVRNFFQTVDVGQNGMIWVFHPDGLILFREPSLEDPIGEKAAGNPIFDASRGSPSGTIRVAVSSGGSVFLNAYSSLKEPPLTVAISLSQAEVLAEWRREVLVSGIFLAVAGFVTIALLVFLSRQIDARAAAEDALIRSQRLESIGKLTGGIAHDFNNLLTVILGYASFFKETRGWSSEQAAARRRIDLIEQAALRGSELVQRLLTFARRQPLRPVILDLNEVVDSVRPMLERILGEDIELRTNPASFPCLANVDSVQVETAIMNLCTNSRDAMTQGGLLVIETSEVELDEEYARLNTEVTAGEYVMVSVTDTGQGIPPEHLAHVFEPFFTTKEAGRGTGLGLSSVYGFVKQSGGHIRIDSQVNQGVSVKMYFPRVAELPPAQVDAEALPQDDIHGHGETILLVEDNAAVRELAQMMLRNLGYNVLAAADGPAALELAREARNIDLLLTDVLLPGGMSGLAVAERITSERPGVTVLYASGYSDEIIEERGHLPSGVRFISKPYRTEELGFAVKNALALP